MGLLVNGGYFMKTYAYLRVSTTDQDNKKFRNDILSYANDKELGTVTFIEEKISGTKDWKKRELGKLIEKAEVNDTIIVPELSRLARSVPQIYEIISACQQKEVWLHIIKQNMIINGKNDMTTKIMISTFSLIAELEKDFISIRTKEALAAKMKAGLKLGRPVGSKSSKLDAHKDEILGLLEMGVTKKKIAEKYDITPQGLYRWMRGNA